MFLGLWKSFNIYAFVNITSTGQMTAIIIICDCLF